MSSDSKERERYEKRMESMLEKTSSLQSAEKKVRKKEKCIKMFMSLLQKMSYLKEERVC